MKLLLIVGFLLSLGCSQDYNPLTPKRHVKRSYVCPPRFIRQGHRCYFFSKDTATFYEAMFRCTDMRSNLAIIKTPNHDGTIRSFLGRKTLDPLERWLGGIYDWKNMVWKWAASGKPLKYSDFENDIKEQNLKWHCIIMDPAYQYRWNARSCLDKKHYICQTKMKMVNSKGKKKLERQYSANKYNKLNEIPVPVLPEYANNSTAPLKSNIPKFEPAQISLNDQALYANVPQKQTRRIKKNKKNTRFVRYDNGTVVEMTGKRRKKRVKGQGKSMMKNIKWRTYRKENGGKGPLYPKPIIEEYNYIKD